MAQVQRDGTFKAHVIERGLGFSKNGALEFSVRYGIDAELVDGEWQDVSQENWEIVGYHYLTKTDGSVNENTVKAIREAFGWDGVNPAEVDTIELPEGHEVQLVIKWDKDDKGRDKLVVAFVNPGDHTGGGVKRCTDEQRRQIAAKLGAKFRARVGSPAPAPAPAGKPTMPKPAPAGPPARTAPTKPAAAVQKMTMEQAWEAFSKALAHHDARKVEAEWLRIVGEMFPTKTDDQVTPEEWAKLATEGPTKFLPV